MTGRELTLLEEHARWRDPALLAARVTAEVMTPLSALLASWGGKMKPPTLLTYYRRFSGEPTRYADRAPRTANEILRQMQAEGVTWKPVDTNGHDG